ncbi:hypothetical protein ACFFHJ_10465 [Planotetraspora thailandica]|uniref:hypothetical protein n=1 Tax=Planotetraspora thailandica TaxID=487172 RepID=UPI00195176B4|nr:hypothetical protein [Planotetraspora thailandica]
MARRRARATWTVLNDSIQSGSISAAWPHQKTVYGVLNAHAAVDLLLAARTAV